MLPRQFNFSYRNQTGFFSIAALVILLSLGVAIYILAGQLKNPTSWISQAEGEPATCTGKMEIPSCYDDGTPTAIKVSWAAPKNPDRDCNVYLNGADPATQEVVSTDCSGQKTYTYITDRLLGNPLGNQDIYQLGLDNGQVGCTVKQLAEIRATEMCQGKKTAGPKPAPPEPESAENCSKIISDFGLNFIGFSKEQLCVISSQLTSINGSFSLVTKLKEISAEFKTEFKNVSSLNKDQSVCSVSEVIAPTNQNTQTLKAVLLKSYVNLLLSCKPDQGNLWPDAKLIWEDYGGVTPATYNPKPRQASPQNAPGCNTVTAKIDRGATGEVTHQDYIAVLASLIDPNFLKTTQQFLPDHWCTDQNPLANKANPRQCQLAQRILTPKFPSDCGQLATVTGNTQYGIQIDYQGGKVPSNEQFKTLGAQWSRFVYKYNYLPSLDANSTSKLVVFNQQSFIPSSWPIGKTDAASWDNYIDKDPKSYFKSLESFVRANSSKVAAIEVWNEPDLTSTQGEKTSYIPPAIYAKMLKGSAKIIKGANPNIKVISAGMAGQNVPKYLQDMQTADKDVFSQVDGVGLHPYSQSPKGWGTNLGLKGDAEWILDATARAANKPVWVTEIGQNFSGQDQATYIDKMYTIFKEKNIPMAGWYAWTDTMLGGPQDKTGYGLYDSSGRLKPSGEMFAKFAKGAK